ARGRGAHHRPAREGRDRWIAAPCALILAALVAEIVVGSALGTLFGGGFRQDRFALFCDILLLVAALIALASLDWDADAGLAGAVPLAALAGMVAASAGNLAVLWAALAVATATPVSVSAAGGTLKRLPGRLLGGSGPRTALPWAIAVIAVGAGLALLGLAGAAGAADALAAVLTLIGLEVLAVLGTLQVGHGPVAGGRGETVRRDVSPLSLALSGGLGGAVALIALLEVSGRLAGGAGWSGYLLVAAAVALAAGGLGAVAASSPARMIAFLGLGQAGWLLSGLAGGHRLSAGAAIYLLGAYLVTLSALPLLARIGSGAGFRSLAGLGAREPARAAGLGLGLLSLAGLPPLAGWFGEFTVAAEMARGQHLWLLALGLLEFVLALAAAFRALALLYLEPEPEGPARAQRSRLSGAGGVGLVLVVIAYGVFANPVHGLAVQGAAALGVR
ncbi:MAG: proton-conducting transporter membrane subunit, partial [Candidatus Dormibacteraceae bacterium]